jgi:hypothetical protein
VILELQRAAQALIRGMGAINAVDAVICTGWKAGATKINQPPLSTRSCTIAFATYQSGFLTANYLQSCPENILCGGNFLRHTAFQSE